MASAKGLDRGGSWRRRLAFAVLAVTLAELLCGGRFALAAGAGAQAGPADAGTIRLSDNRTAYDIGSFQRAPESKQLDLEIVFALRNASALDDLLAEQQDPESRLYHRWLSPREFAARFGPSQATFNAVGEWLESQGLPIVSAKIANRYIEFKAAASQARKTFGTPIVASDDGRLYANTADPLIPARFAGVISRIEGLDNIRAAMPLIRRYPASVAASPDSQAPDPAILLGGQGPYFGPSDFYTFYDELPLVGGGIDGPASDCIALVEDSNYLDAAVSDFNSKFDLPAASIAKVFADTTDPGIGALDDEVEALLDIEWAHAVAPGAPIKVYIGNEDSSSANGPIIDAIQQAVSEDSCAAISVSFATCGPPASFYRGVADSIFAQGASQGQSVFLSSGDEGAAGLVFDAKTESCVTGSSRNVSELSADPNVTAVGGTQFTPVYDRSGNDRASVAESAWNQSNGATGGGASTVFPKPSYQVGLTSNDGARDVPDVAAIAGPPGVLLDVRRERHPDPRMLLRRHESRRADLGRRFHVDRTGSERPAGNSQSANLRACSLRKPSASRCDFRK